MRIHFLILLGCLAISCGKQSHWAFDQIHSNKSEFCSTKLTYRSLDPAYGINLEFLKTQDSLNTYLNVHSIPLKGKQKDVPLKIEIDGKVLRASAYRLAGGQRFLLPQETANLLIDALKNGKEVSMTLVEYKTTFKPDDFSQKFEKLLHPLPIQNPFHLPF